MIAVDHALRTFVGALSSLHGLVFHLLTVGGRPHRPRRHPLLRVLLRLPRGPVLRRRRNRPRLSYAGFVWMVVGPRLKPGVCVRRDGCGLHPNAFWVLTLVWVWDPSGVGRLGCRDDCGRGGCGSRSDVAKKNVYKHVCIHLFACRTWNAQIHKKYLILSINLLSYEQYYIIIKYPYFFWCITCLESTFPQMSDSIWKVWSPPGFRTFPVSNEVEWGGLHGLHMESLESTWNPSGIQVEADNNLAGLPAKGIPPGLHVEHMDSMDSTWIPPGIYGGG
jgi:hypothetical protein